MSLALRKVSDVGLVNFKYTFRTLQVNFSTEVCSTVATVIVDVETSAFVLRSAITEYFYYHIIYFNYTTVNCKCGLVHCVFFWSVKTLILECLRHI